MQLHQISLYFYSPCLYTHCLYSQTIINSDINVFDLIMFYALKDGWLFVQFVELKCLHITLCHIRNVSDLNLCCKINLNSLYSSEFGAVSFIVSGFSFCTVPKIQNVRAHFF